MPHKKATQYIKEATTKLCISPALYVTQNAFKKGSDHSDLDPSYTIASSI